MTKLEKILLFLLFFLIPSNLAYHLDSIQHSAFSVQLNNAVVDGILIDYLLPKVYLTDLLIFTLLLLWLIKNWHSLTHKISKLVSRSSLKKLKINLLSIPCLLFAFLLTTALKIPSSTNPAAALWFWLKLVELIFLIWYLRSMIYDLASIIYSAFSVSLVWQSLLALAQWVRQTSITPYWLLGESQFSATTPGIAKASFLGYLKVLPMGTTPHPNILAGFIAVSTIIVWLSSSKTKDSFKIHLSSISALAPVRLIGGTRASIAQKKVNLVTGSKYIITITAVVALLLTQSLTAIGVLILAAILISLNPNSGTHSSILTKSFITLALVLLIIWKVTPLSNVLEPTSLSRRSTLSSIATRMITDHPLLGVGLNNFTANMQTYGDVEATYRFFQPVHNISLLLLSETGLIGFVLIILIFWQTLKKLLKIGKLNSWSIPLLMLLLIGLADHYPLTLQTGQLLMALTIGLAQPRINT